MSTPKDLLYSTNHEWIKLSDDGGRAVIGITDFAQLSLGDILFVNLCAPGDKITAGDAIGDVESIKSVSELISPVSGICDKTNERALETPDMINRDPYGAWLVEVIEVKEVSGLISAEEYEVFISSQ